MTDWTDLRAIIVDAAGTELSAEERDLFAAEKPAGFILFKRNCVSKQQVADLVAAVRDAAGQAAPPPSPRPPLPQAAIFPQILPLWRYHG